MVYFMFCVLALIFFFFLVNKVYGLTFYWQYVKNYMPRPWVQFPWNTYKDEILLFMHPKIDMFVKLINVNEKLSRVCLEKAGCRPWMHCQSIWTDLLAKRKYISHTVALIAI